MNIVILDDYQDAVRKLQCASKLDPYTAKVYTNTVKGLGQLSVRLKDADIIAVASSPLADVTQLERPTFVMHRGPVARIGGQRAPFPPN